MPGFPIFLKFYFY